jgi:hypothetical protein
MPYGVVLKSFETLAEAMANSQKQPAIGITQGGSSSKHSGARVAARDADTQHKPKN